VLDVLWVEKDQIVALFEVEATTSMTSGLVRGSNVAGPVARYLVIPEEREEQLQKRLKSPMFAERFLSDGWQVIDFDRLQHSLKALKAGRMKLDQLASFREPLPREKSRKSQLQLF
jgi:hypothetical protein